MDCLKSLVLPKYPLTLFSHPSKTPKLSLFPFTLHSTKPQASSTTTTLSPPQTTKTKTTHNITHVTPKKVLVPIGFGTEEMEAVIIAGVLRSAGAQVIVASVEPQLEVQASAGTRLVADVSISECEDMVFDLVALPSNFRLRSRLGKVSQTKMPSSLNPAENLAKLFAK